MMTWSRSLIVCVTVCWVAVSAGAMPDDPSVDPCTLVSKAEVEHIIGRLKGNPAFSQVERARLCNYEFTDDKNALELWVFPASGLERARTRFKDLSPVTGLGHEALMRRNKDVQYIELFVKKGTVTLEVTMKELPGDEEKVKTIARKALTRL
jgi:hypothetical protein